MDVWDQKVGLSERIPSASTISVSRRVAAPRRSWLRLALAVLVAILLPILYHLRHGCPKPSSKPDDQSAFDWAALQPRRDLRWTPCYAGQKCARLLLPLDYDTPDGPTVAIAIRMIPATDLDNYRGTIFLNPGGPGVSGVDFVEQVGTDIARIVGSSFDILGFDPRGVGRTTPSDATCFDTVSERALFATQEGPQLINASGEALGIAHARARVVAERCAERIGGEWGIGRFAITPNVARDMLEMSRLLGQEQVQYWGFSYETILGQFFAGMYPDKVKRFVLDGVGDAELHRAGSVEEDLVYTDDVVDSLFTFCFQAGPEACAMYDSSAAKIRERYFHILDEVSRNPVPVALADPPLVITRKTLITQLFQSTFDPLSSFPSVVQTIRALETNNQTALASLARQISNPTECKCDTDNSPFQSGYTEAVLAVLCGDGPAYSFDRDAFARTYEHAAAQSPLMAPMRVVWHIRCADWKIRPKWRYTGPVHSTNTAHPLLLVSTQYDPVCPLTQARDVRSRFGSAGLLTQNSYGHCSMSSPSLCTAKQVREYFVNGTLPKEGATCEVDELPFVGRTQNVRALSTADQELLEALRNIAGSMPFH
ncbi:alpha/beta-hydrolase [Earliella scabrosa]|nr:alpha/beta-hydrolase [Earliella scabrosa]